jgi:hypothetical protein
VGFVVSLRNILSLAMQKLMCAVNLNIVCHGADVAVAMLGN